MKRVVHVAKFYPPVPGGMERVVQMLCRASEGLVESRVLALNTGPATVDEVVEGVPVTRVGVTARAGSVPIAPSLPAQLRRLQADLVILHEPHPWALLSYGIARPPAPLAVWYHSDVVRPALQYKLFYAPLARAVYPRARTFIVSSPPLGEHASPLAPYRDRIRVIPFGIDPEQWQTDAGCAEEPFVLFVGRHVPYKGVDVLIRALDGTGVRAVIAGDGPRRSEWQALAASLKVEATFTGDIADGDLRDLYRRCAAFVLPSVTRAEAFGYVQLEAMAAGKPVISTDVPSGVPWINQHEQTGLVVPAGASAPLRSAIVRLMRDRDLRRRMGRAGRKRVESAFSMDQLRDRLRELFEAA